MKHVSKRSVVLLISSLFYLVFLTGCNDVKPQWEAERNSLTSDFTNSVLVDPYGDIVVTADSYLTEGNETRESFVVAKYNSSGSLVWDYSYDDESYRVFAVDSDDSGNIFVAGARKGGIFLTKIYSNGMKAWTNLDLDGDWTTGGLKISGENVYFACKTLYSIDNQSGEVIWSAPNDLRVNSLTTDDEENIYIAGYEFLASYDNLGHLRWKNQFEEGSGFVNLAFNSNKELFVSKFYGQSSVKLEKIEKSTGAVIASATETGSGIWWPKIACDGSGNIILAFSSDNKTNGRRVIKYTGSLSKKWSKSFESGARSMDLSDLAVALNGDIYITGGDTTEKIDSNGKVVATITSGSIYTNNYLALNKDQSKIYLATSADHPNNKNISLAQYNTK